MTAAACFFSETTGLVGAFVGNTVSGHAQPALIYLLPAVVIAIVIRGYAIGKLHELWLGKTEASTV